MSDTSLSAPRPETGTVAPVEEVLVFRIGEELLAFPTRWVVEILHLPDLSHPPGSPQHTAGFLNLGGDVIPVLRLEQILGLPGFTPSLYSPLLLVRLFRDLLLGMLVERVEGVVRPGPGGGRVPSQHVFNGTASALLTVGDHPVHLLDPEKVLLGEEVRRLREFRKVQQKRLAGIRQEGGA